VSAPILAGLLVSGAIGAGVGRLLRLPMWALTGAILGAAAFHLTLGGGGGLPWWWTFTAQVAVGSVVGSRLGPTVLKDFRAILVPGITVVLVVIPAGIGLGLAIWSTGRAGLVESVFGMVPGGVGEMVAAVTSLHGDSALVAGMHLVRLLVVLTALHFAVRWLRRRGKDAGTAE
jgi:membrane AbrB-like protein